jgi:hypothetical protein
MVPESMEIKFRVSLDFLVFFIDDEAPNCVFKEFLSLNGSNWCRDCGWTGLDWSSGRLTTTCDGDAWRN